MSLSAPEAPPWGLIQWIVTGIGTGLASSIAFLWRLAHRVDGFESALATHTRACESSATANDAAMLRLSDRLQQIHDDHFRLRETIGALPSRAELRDAEDRIIEQISVVAARLDRTIERRDG